MYKAHFKKTSTINRIFRSIERQSFTAHKLHHTLHNPNTKEPIQIYRYKTIQAEHKKKKKIRISEVGKLSPFLQN